jgi:hypothetical protein
MVERFYVRVLDEAAQRVQSDTLFRAFPGLEKADSAG